MGTVVLVENNFVSALPPKKPGLDAGKHVPCILYSSDICQTRHNIRRDPGTVLPSQSVSQAPYSEVINVTHKINM